MLSASVSKMEESKCLLIVKETHNVWQTSTMDYCAALKGRGYYKQQHGYISVLKEKKSQIQRACVA